MSIGKKIAAGASDGKPGRRWGGCTKARNRPPPDGVLEENIR
jgi:hypothetical protein